MAKRIVYTVTGRLPFPWDMLRYDASYPTDNGVQGLMAMYPGGPCRDRDPKVVYSVELVCPHGSITPDRWRSFGWPVVAQEVRHW